MPVSIERKPPLAIVSVDNPPVNALSHAVREGLMNACTALEAEHAIEAVILICNGRTFIAGADIREFGQTPKEPHLPDVIHAIEASSKPWVAAIHGTALGGGCEVALGCPYRIAPHSAKLGLPEVNLGLIPGAGGTVRLPQIIGIPAAIDMITSGKPIGAEKAATLGLIDELVPIDTLMESAEAFGLSICKQPIPKLPSVNFDSTAFDDAAWEEIISGVKAKAKGQASPVEAALSIRDGVTLPRNEAFSCERERFIRLRDSDQSGALRHVFFAERQTTKIDIIKGVDPKPVNHCGVIGGGTMGAGIAAAMLLSGLTVTMIERDHKAAEAGNQRVVKILEGSRSRGILSNDKFDTALSRLAVNTDYNSLATTDLVIEAVFEDMNVKKQVFANLEKACSKDCILATNTSYLDVNEIASSVSDPNRVLGLHFFSPAHIMKLVEIIKTDSVSNQTLATGFALAKTLRKTPVLAGVCDGFIGNRILFAYRKKCDYMLEDGASPQDIDNALKDFGFAMGPFEMQDMAGLDIGWANRKRLAPTRNPDERYVKIADRLCELGRFGQKTRAGWYDYSGGARKGVTDPVVDTIIDEERKAAGITPRKFTAREIQDTILGTMVSEGKAIMDEGIARSASDIDIVFIMGYGFPRWRGGPMYCSGVFD
ncbi:MAG: 3-hydroxyacyl-CoA dehydrogenase NAD-binding domain-containing protein [Pseudomonadota bacterium]